MKLFLKQKLVSIFRERYSIKDENKKVKYWVNPIFSFVPKYEILDENDNLLFVIKKKMFTILPKYKILSKDKELLFSVNAKFTLMKPKVKIYNEKDEQQFEISGNILGFEYSILSNGEEKAKVGKKLLRVTDSYTLEIFDELNAGLYVCFAMIFDLMYFKKKRSLLIFKG